jgi:lipopolysaccharide transport system permease protein
MLGVYTFVFAGVFQARWGGDGNLIAFVLMLYCGLIVYALAAETLSRSPTVIIGNPSYVKKVVFPLEILPLSQLGAAIFNMLVSLTLLIIFTGYHQGFFYYTLAYLPLILLPYIILIAGAAWFFAALGVFFRDVSQLVTISLSVLLFLSPVFYPSSAVPKTAQYLLTLNPLTFPIEQLRQVILLGEHPNLMGIATYTGAALTFALLGLWIFQKSRAAFPDVL